MKAIDPLSLAHDLTATRERRDGEPANRSGKAAKRVLFVSGVIAHAGQRGRVKGLHEQGPDSANECAKVAVDDPRCVGWHIEPGLVATRNNLKPWRCAAGVSRQQSSKSLREVLLECVISGHCN